MTKTGKAFTLFYFLNSEHVYKIELAGDNVSHLLIHFLIVLSGGLRSGYSN